MPARSTDIFRFCRSKVCMNCSVGSFFRGGSEAEVDRGLLIFVHVKESCVLFRSDVLGQTCGFRVPRAKRAGGIVFGFDSGAAGLRWIWSL